MKENVHDIELIERYFDNSLTAEETEVLKERLRKDDRLQKLFNDERLLINTIRYQAARKDLEFLKGVERSLGKDSRRGIKRDLYYYAAAACVALLALALWRPWAQETPAELFNAYYEPYPNIFEPVLRGEESTPRSQAFQAYEQQQYEQASILFSGLLREQRDAGMLLLLGNANLMTGKTEVATSNFKDLIAGYEELDTEAKWYLSLCYLKTGEAAAARDLLKEIAGKNTPESAKAAALLKDLN